ncbi:hypothetical protein VEJY3_08530 [Vibrio sp. EJY3]|nr:hypothetical protein VEJY3_08530 [Vibrio sp. EJY3]
MNKSQFEHWSKTRTKGFLQYVFFNSISILFVVFAIRFIMHSINGDEVSMIDFIIEQSLEMVVILLVLPFSFWCSWVIKEARYEKEKRQKVSRS